MGGAASPPEVGEEDRGVLGDRAAEVSCYEIGKKMGEPAEL